MSPSRQGLRLRAARLSRRSSRPPPSPPPTPVAQIHASPRGVHILDTLPRYAGHPGGGNASIAEGTLIDAGRRFAPAPAPPGHLPKSGGAATADEFRRQCAGRMRAGRGVRKVSDTPTRATNFVGLEIGSKLSRSRWRGALS